MTLAKGLENRCKQIDDALVEAARLSEQGRTPKLEKSDQELRLESMISKRRNIPNHCTKERSDASKAIQKELKAIKKAKHRAKIESILNEFRDLRSIADIKTRQKRKHMTSMLNSEGKECFERQGIADIFADFYEELYRSKRSDDNAFPEEGAACGLPACEKDVVPFSKEELVVAIKKLKNNKCKDTSGVVGEMFKHAGPQLREILLDLYNEVLKGSETPPQKWKESVVRVLYKSGPSNAAANYRPITIIQLLYKLFAILLLNRIEPTIEKQQRQTKHHTERDTVPMTTYSSLPNCMRRHWSTVLTIGSPR